MKPLSIAILLLCLSFLLVPEPAAGQTTDENIHIHADHMSQDRAEALYIANGNVAVNWKGSTLTADKVRYNSNTRMLYADGAVVLTKEKSILKGEALVMNTETGHAEIDPALLTVPDKSIKIKDPGQLATTDKSMTIKAGKITRVSEDKYKGITTELTSCDIVDPSWKFGADRLDVDLKGYATGRHVIFYVKNIPVLYLPWIAFPVSHERRSGLLFPRFSNSDNRGIQLDIPVYWAISPNQDLQVDLDIMSRRGVGTGVNYRYIRTRGSEGHFGAFQIYDKQDNKWRWQIEQDHKEIFSPNANLRMSVNKSSDRLFFSDYGEISGEYNRQSSQSIINTLNAWQDYAVTAHLRYNENLYSTGNQSTLQTMPSLGIAGVRHSLFSTPLYFDVDSFANNFHRDTAPSGQRLYLFPRVSLLPFKNSFAQTTLYAGTHIRGYNTANRDINGNVEKRTGDILPEAGVRISSSLTRSYEVDSSSLKTVRHEIIPEISYTFVPRHDQQRLPIYDYGDRIIYQNMVKLSATNLINGTFAAGTTTEHRELSRIKVEARYSFAGEQRDLLTTGENSTPWSDLIVDSESWLTRELKFFFDTRYSFYGDNASSVATGLEFDNREGSSVKARYHMARGGTEYFEGSFSSTRIKPMKLSYTARYSFDRSDFLESVYSAEYRHQCWGVQLAVHQRPGNNSFSVNITLAGLGGK